MYVNREEKYILKIKLKSKLSVVSGHREMWTSLCNFLCNKLFHRQKIGFQRRSDSNESIYGKRLKLVDRFWNTSDVVNQNSSPLSMQKDNIEISDDEECCIIAEIPRRKKAWSCVDLEKKPGPAVRGATNLNDSGSLSTITLRKSPFHKANDAEEVQFLGRNSIPDENTKAQAKKFFVCQRVCRNQGKVAKSRFSYKNYLRKKMNYLQESYRLTEKFQYIQLLQSHTTFNLLTVRPSLKSIKGPPKPIKVIDLTDESTNSVVESKSEDQDVQIVKEVTGVRSFQDLLKIRPVNPETEMNKILSVGSKSSSDAELMALSKNISSLLDDDFSSQNIDEDNLEEKLHNFMIISTQTVEELESGHKQNDLPELSNQQQQRVKDALIPEPSDEVLSQGFGLQITRRDMQTLFGLNWLNDEVINFYCNLIMARSETNSKLPKVYAFNTFFYPNLVTSGYSSIRRWTKRVDIFSFDLILVPIHLGMHWCMSIIDFRNKSVRYYDSIGSPNDSCLKTLLLYLKAESLDKKKKLFSTVNWETTNVDDIPQQMNGADCGVFSCMFAEYLTRDCNISFTQDDMPYFRQKIIIEILDKKLLT